MGMAFGFGFIAGPALGGLLGAIDPRLPFYAAGGLAFANFVFGLVFLRETLAHENRRPFDWRRANAFAALRALRGQSASVIWLVAALGVWMLAHTVYPAIWTYFAMAAYGFDTTQVGLALAVVGLSSALVQGLGLRWVAPWLGERNAVLIGTAGFAISAVMYWAATSTAFVYAAILVGSVQGFIQPSVQALNSRAVDARSQGELQGATQSIGSIAAIVAPPLYAGVFAKFNGPGAMAQTPAMPLLVAAGFSLIGLGLFLAGLRRMPARANASPA
jgi:DHA1 family tetracycline resistance protein-like MFS transporter